MMAPKCCQYGLNIKIKLTEFLFQIVNNADVLPCFNEALNSLFQKVVSGKLVRALMLFFAAHRAQPGNLSHHSQALLTVVMTTIGH